MFVGMDLPFRTLLLNSLVHSQVIRLNRLSFICKLRIDWFAGIIINRRYVFRFSIELLEAPFKKLFKKLWTELIWYFLWYLFELLILLDLIAPMRMFHFKNHLCYSYLFNVAVLYLYCFIYFCLYYTKNYECL